jgi:vitamin B12 transporter
MRGKLLFALATFVSTAGAQEPRDTVQLDPVVATATRVALPASKVTAAVSVIDGAELRRRGVRTVADALRAVSGATVVQTGSYGASTSLFLRGGESDYVQLLVDGVQVNSPGEQYNWSNLAIEDVERIEILKGPASVLYGSDAVTGVVQVFTKRRLGRPRSEVALSGGRGEKIGTDADGGFNNGYARAELFGGSDRLTYSVGGSHFNTDGAYAFNNQHRNTSVTARASARAGAAFDLNGSVRYSKSRFHLPTDGTGQITDRNQYQDAASLAAGIGLTRRFSSRLDAQLELQHSHNDGLLEDQPDDAADTLGFYSFHSDERFSRQNVQLRANYVTGQASTFTLGGELERQSNRASSTSPFGDTPETTEERNNKAFYAQWLGDWARATAQLGARVEDNEKFGNFTTYRAGVSVKVVDALRLRAAGGTAYKEPRFFEQFAQGFVRGNPELEPEQSRSLEVGADLTWRGATINATYFDQKFKDLIQYISIPPSPADPNYVNVAGARAAGLEMSGRYVLSQLVLGATYTHLDTHVTDEGDGQDPSFIEGERLLRRPRHSGSVHATVLTDAANLSSTLHFVGRRDDLNFASFPAERVSLPSYTRLDVAGELRVTTALTGTIKIENALDQAYQEVLGFPALQRVIHAGVRLSF